VPSPGQRADTDRQARPKVGVRLRLMPLREPGRLAQGLDTAAARVGAANPGDPRMVRARGLGRGDGGRRATTIPAADRSGRGRGAKPADTRRGEAGIRGGAARVSGGAAVCVRSVGP